MSSNSFLGEITCIDEGNIEGLFGILKENCININKIYKIGDYQGTLLHYSIKQKKPKISEMLIRVFGIDVNILDKNGFLPVHLAVSLGDTEVVQIIMNNGSDVNLNQKDGYGNAPIHIAVKLNNIELVEVLLSYGADINCKRSNGSTIIHELVRLNNKKMFEMITEKHTINYHILGKK
jgi:ankyrin repeat protein